MIVVPWKCGKTRKFSKMCGTTTDVPYAVISTASIFRYFRSIHSSFASIASADTSLRQDASLGKMLITRVRRLISSLNRLIMLVVRIRFRWGSEGHRQQRFPPHRSQGAPPPWDGRPKALPPLRPVNEVCDIIFQERGNQFDHEVVDAFGEVVGEIVEITRTISMSGVDKKPFSPFSF